MICVSLGRTRHKMMIAEHQSLAQRGAELVELRLDWLSHLPDLTRLLKERPTPVIVTCRRGQDKGLWKGTEEQRQTILRAAIISEVEYVDLEEDTASKIRRYGKTKRIVSHHDFEETPLDLEVIHARLCKLDPDIVKIVTMAHTPADSIRMLKLVQNAKVPTVGFCMGELGGFSRILCGKFGSPFTYATFSKDREMAPGQFSFEDMKQIFRYDQIGPETEVYGVLGDPVGHSMSPLIHNAAFKTLGLNKVYVPFRVPRDQLVSTLEQFKWLGVKGYSVTIPHKESIVAMTKNYDGPVAEIGAANTLYRDANAKWWSANSDSDAALQSLALAGTDADGKVPTPEEFLAGKKVLVLGCGGVARAIGMGIMNCGGALTVTNRTHARAVELAKHLGCQQVSWENRGAQYADVLINCTSVGMHPGINESPFAENWLREGMVVFDTIYNPEQTLFLKQAKMRGCKTVSGVEMFVRQAAVQFQKFTGQPAPLEIMQRKLRRVISAVTVKDEDDDQPEVKVMPS
ncbi:MAG: shikimate dehydrogenase [Planctomycetota bacterium]